MTLKIYNSLSREKEEFTPIHDNKVTMYVCGMTVYSDAHIGHARTYFAFDMVRRYLQFKGYDVLYVQNVTDVDDKIINAANKENVDALDYSCGFTDRCLGDLDLLGIHRADLYPKASETIDDMIKMIQQIIDRGYGYEADGDVYFAVEKFPEYGKLSGQRVEDLMSGARIEPGDKKQSPLDFALWKQAKPGEPFWESPWGKGRPGWHIECSAMSSKFLGLPFDIHGGGMDLQFPHHENEIAQAEAATGKAFARFWMHCGLLTIDGEKMSKSLGNIVNICDLLKEWPAEVIRFFFAKTHYRRPPDFNKQALEDAEKGVNRLYRFKEQLEDFATEKSCSIDRKSLDATDEELYSIVDAFKDSFEKAMDDDFNTPEALASLYSYSSQVNRYLQDHSNPNPEVCRYALDVLKQCGYVLTLFQDEVEEDDEEIVDSLKTIYQEYVKDESAPDCLDDLLTGLLKQREQARKEKQWNVADDIRDKIECLGFEIQDTNEGPVWRKRK
jgi:cysteinyl-tRNA synthetase